MKVASLQSYQLSFDWLFEHEICRIFVFGCDIGLQGTPIKGIAWLWASPTGPFGCGAIHDQLGHSMRFWTICLACSKIKRKNVVRIVAIEWKKSWSMGQDRVFSFLVDFHSMLHVVFCLSLALQSAFWWNFHSCLAVLLIFPHTTGWPGACAFAWEIPTLNPPRFAKFQPGKCGEKTLPKTGAP